MANWCSNYVTFSGKEEDIEKIYAVFKEMKVQEELQQQGQLSPFHNDKMLEGYFFELYLDDDMKETIQYETKWAPNTGDVQLIADQFNLDYEHQYHEPGMSIFGKYIYKDKTLTNYFLDNPDFEDFDWDDDKDEQTYKGETVDSEEELLEDIFKNKFGIEY